LTCGFTRPAKVTVDASVLDGPALDRWVKGSQIQILSSRPAPGSLTLDGTPRQRAFFTFSVDLVRFGPRGVEDHLGTGGC
jgi:hypothetical protein